MPQSPPTVAPRAGRPVLSRARSLPRLGVVMLLIIGGACVVTLPWTLGAADGARTPRYAATDTAAALLPPFWAPHTAAEREQVQDLAASRDVAVRPWLGTDRLGRSVLARCLLGGAISLGIGLAAATIAVAIGTAVGTLAGWRGGRTDALLMRSVDVLYGLPSILLVVLLAVAVDGLVDRAGRDLGPAARQIINIATLLVAIGGISWLTMARVVRGQTMSLRTQPFMEACRAIGVPVHRQFTRHLLPNLLGPIIVYATLTVPQAILSESFLSFLGIGVQEPLPSWGNLAADGLSELNLVRSRWWLLLWPCVLIALTLISLNFVGEWLRERHDPRRTP